jgi:hypothetical protein
MSEWVSVLAVFWVLWLIDGAKVGPRRAFTFLPGWRRRGAATYGRISRPSPDPGGWRINAADIPLAFGATGVCNRSAGAAGRPANPDAAPQAWRWPEIKAVGVAAGWIYVNGRRFCPDTGHVTGPELWAMAQAAPAEQARWRAGMLARWFRPRQIVGRRRLLLGRTRWVAALNTLVLAGVALLTLYLAGDIAGRVPARAGERMAQVIPWFVLGLLLMHGTAVVLAARALRRLKAVGPEKRRANLLSAGLLPPQALRLRALLAEGFFPAQHPLAVSLAVGSPRVQAELAFNVVADLRWPLGETDASPLAREILAEFRAALTAKVTAELAPAGLTPEGLVRPPVADSAGSRLYCPRCRAQFVAGRTVCPQGVVLERLEPKRGCGGS